MIKIGSSDVDTIKIGSTDVDKVMLGGEQLYPPDAECEPITGDAATLLAPYNPTDPLYTNETTKHRVYPMGREMLKSAWLARSQTSMTDIKANGFTAFGPSWDTREIIQQPEMDRAVATGLRAVVKINDGAGFVSTLCPKMDNGSQEATLFSEVEYRINQVNNYPNANSQTDIWLTGTEELSTRGTSYDGTGECATSTLQRYLQKFEQHVSDHDPEQKPLWMCDVTGARAYQMNGYFPWVDMYGVQMYTSRIDTPSMGGKMGIIQSLTQEMLDSRSNMDSNYPQEYNPRFVTATFDCLYEPADNSQAWLDKFVGHNLYVTMVMGIQGFSVYSWEDYTTVDPTPGEDYHSQVTLDRYHNAYNKKVKEFTDNGLDQAFLWGQRKSDISIALHSGPANADWGTSYDAASLLSINLQMGSRRFIVLTNSHWDEDVTARLSGFVADSTGGQLLLKNLVTGASFSLANNYIHDEVVGPEEYRLFEIVPHPDYCDGGEPCVDPSTAGIHISTCYPRYWRVD